MDMIIDLVNKYGLNTVILALIINILTQVLKLPIKKITDDKNITRLIVFMPIVLGFIITYLFKLIIYKEVVFNQEFMNLFISSTSLSLSFYAIFEKIFPKREKEDGTIEASQEVLNMISKVIEEEKIVLKGKR